MSGRGVRDGAFRLGNSNRNVDPLTAIRVLRCWWQHEWKLDGGVCADGWIWTTNRCERCGAWQNELMRLAVELHNRASRPEPAPIAIGVCAHCHRDILDTDATDETGTLHFEPCAGEAAAMLQDMLTDRAREAELVREWGGR